MIEIILIIKQSKYGLMYHPQYLLFYKYGGDGIFGREYYTIGKPMMDEINDRLHKLFSMISKDL